MREILSLTVVIRCNRRVCLVFYILFIFAGVAPLPSLAQIPDVTVTQRPEPEIVDETVQTMLPHPAGSRFWISGQINFIFQANAAFHAAYSGTNSFKPNYDSVFSQTATLYTGFQINRSSEVLVDVETSGPLGLSGGFGLAGFPNFDAVTDSTLNQAPYLARCMFHHVIALSPTTTEVTAGPLSTFTQLPTRRLELRIGKFSTNDFIDGNVVGSDSHLQFLNWAIDQNGAWDFSSDPRGYNWGVLVEYQGPLWGLRFMEALIAGPKNSDGLEWNLRKGNTSTFEFELHRGFLPRRPGIIRVLSFINNGNMGIYKDANEQFLNGQVSQPDLTRHPEWVTTKYGFGANFEQSLTRHLIAFGRFGWNNGKTESWSFTEIDQVFAGGLGALGGLWKRRYDRAGIALATSGISRPHATYLSYGGLGLRLGDGKLTYGRENVLEAYYTAHIWRGLFVGPDLQYLVNPGFNKDRGPVVLPAFRIHVEL